MCPNRRNRSGANDKFSLTRPKERFNVRVRHTSPQQEGPLCPLAKLLARRHVSSCPKPHSARVPTKALSFMLTREAAHCCSPRGRAARRQAAGVGEAFTLGRESPTWHPLRDTPASTPNKSQASAALTAAFTDVRADICVALKSAHGDSVKEAETRQISSVRGDFFPSDRRDYWPVL